MMRSQDLRYAVDAGRTPAFTAVAILTLALGIGATTAIFSVVHGVLMKPLPYAIRRLHNIWVDLGVGNQSLPAVSPLDYLDYRERATLFEGFAAATGGGAVGATGALAGTKTLETERVDVTPVAANFFQLFGVDPVLGRHFLPAEEKPGSPQVAILSHRLWKRRFAADPAIVGRQIILDGIDHTVVGVMPESFTLWLPAEAFLVTDAEIWKPLRYNYEAAPARNFTTLHGLRPAEAGRHPRTGAGGDGGPRQAAAARACRCTSRRTCGYASCRSRPTSSSTWSRHSSRCSGRWRSCCSSPAPTSRICCSPGRRRGSTRWRCALRSAPAAGG